MYPSSCCRASAPPRLLRKSRKKGSRRGHFHHAAGRPVSRGPRYHYHRVLLSSEAVSWLHSLILLASIGIIYAVTFILFRFASHYLHLISEIAFKFIARLMGLLLISIAIQFILDGVRASGLLDA